MEKLVTDLEEQVHKITKIVVGNGEIGMAETLRNVGNDVTTIKDTLTTHVENDTDEDKRRKSRRECLLEKLLMGTIALILSGIGTIFAYGMRIYPSFVKLLETIP